MPVSVRELHRTQMAEAVVVSSGGQALNLTSDARATCGTVETDPAVLALYHEECNATDLEIWTALPLDISHVGLPSRNLIIHGYTVRCTSYCSRRAHARVSIMHSLAVAFSQGNSDMVLLQ